MSARTESPVTVFLASVIAHAADAQDPKIDRLALIASDLLGKIATDRQRVDHPIARLFGWSGPVAGLDRPTGIAADVLARAQMTLDGDQPDPAAISAGIGAARRLIATTGATANSDAQAYMGNVLLARFVDESGVRHDHSGYPRPRRIGRATQTPWECCRDNRYAPGWWTR